MAKLNCVANRNSLIGLLAAVSLMLLAPGVHAAFDKVTTYQDANGWKL
jgi:hypothetical protein